MRVDAGDAGEFVIVGKAADLLTEAGMIDDPVEIEGEGANEDERDDLQAGGADAEKREILDRRFIKIDVLRPRQDDQTVAQHEGEPDGEDDQLRWLHTPPDRWPKDKEVGRDTD